MNLLSEKVYVFGLISLWPEITRIPNLPQYEMNFLKSRPGANDYVFKDAEGKIVWNPGASYFVNELSFLNEDGYLVNLIFGGEVYICNDEGKTVHRIHRSGFVRHEPLPEAA